MSISKLLDERKLPEIPERDKIVDLLLKNEYGIIPDTPYEIKISDPVDVESRYCAGTVCHSYINMEVTSSFGGHSFPVHRLLHTDGSVHPFFVLLNFKSGVPDTYYPAEEIADMGFDVLSVCYQDITADNGDFSDGLASVLLKNGQESDTDCGKIMLWSWTASRILDYAGTLPCLDMKNAAVVGHSRLGKTALVTGMRDPRFKYVFSNDSGCSGAALSRKNTGETVGVITKNFPHWFCKKYRSFADKNYADEFDQHFLIASIAPRYAYVASGSMDAWADPDNEFLSCVAASVYYEKMGIPGFIHNDRLPKDDEIYHEGRIGYHRRYGMHFLSRHDWKRFADYINLHKNDM